jgi:EAL and modified HD-GYP domain-containing signal transduction protein
MDVMVTRQPILDKSESICAYELLFDSGTDNSTNSDINDPKTLNAVLQNCFQIIGMTAMTGGKPIFIHYNKSLLNSSSATMFPKHIVRVVILKSVKPDREVLQACERLKEAGYQFVFDDFALESGFEAFLAMASVIRIDFAKVTGADRRRIVVKHARPGVQFMADNVENHEDFREGIEYGYDYYQGGFISKPNVDRANSLPGYKHTLLELLQAINEPEIEFERLEELIKRDIAISYHLLDYMNSTFFGFSNKVRSIKQALGLLGLEEVRKWLSVMALANVTDKKTVLLIATSLTRAHLLEKLARKCDLSQSVMFLVGLFSLIDAFLDRPMDAVLSELALAADIKKTLLGEDTEMRKLLDLGVAYERGDWRLCRQYADELSITYSDIPNCYTEAVEETAKVMHFCEA